MGRLRSRVAGCGPEQTELFISPSAWNRMLRRMFGTEREDVMEFGEVVG